MGESNLLEGPVFLPTGPFPLKGVAAAIAERYQYPRGAHTGFVLVEDQTALRLIINHPRPSRLHCEV